MFSPTLAILAWIPACAVLFAVIRAERALIIGYLVGWLALPLSSVSIQGLPDLDKVLATNLGVAVGMLLFQPHRLFRYRFHVADAVVLTFAASAAVASFSNGLGAYNAFASMFQYVLRYFVPYLFGRMLIQDLRTLHDALYIVLIGASIYALAAQWEWRMSPRLHDILYGFRPSSHGWQRRWGFWRSVVCFPNTLGLATFFMWTSLLAIAFYRSPPVRLGPWLRGAILALPLLGLLTTEAVGPWALFAGGLVLLHFVRRWHNPKLILLPALFAVVWIGFRYTAITDGRWLSEAIAAVAPERAGSLEYRIRAEDLLIERARQRPFFGWDGWGRNRVTDFHGNDIIATDGFWVICVGQLGLFGLTLFLVWWLWPLSALPRLSRLGLGAPVVAALLLAFSLQGVNLLFNAFLSPILVVLHGAMLSCVPEAQPTRHLRAMRWQQAHRRVARVPGGAT